MDSTLIFSLGLLIVAAAMAYTHHRTWIARRQGTSDDNEQRLAFVDRQCRRRMQASVMLALVAIAIFAGRWIDLLREEAPWIFIVYWMVVIVVVFWVILLALADYVASRGHLAQAERDQIIREAQLRAELRELERNSGPATDDAESR